MRCELCGHEDKTAADILDDVRLMDDHLRVMHPDEYGDGPERWPDGSVVLHDETLEPEDFA
jgi:hypothetical protein